MKLLTLFFTIQLVSCTQYLYDVNELHTPLTTFDKVSRSVKYCIYMNNKTLDVNYLIGTWYTIYKFAAGITGLKSETCWATNFTSPTKEELDKYKAKYDLKNESFTFDDAVIYSESQGSDRILKGIVAGSKTAKYFFLEPDSRQRLNGMYEVHTYKPVNNDYMIYYDCNMRGNVKYLMSKRKDQTDEELETILKPLYELERFDKNRYCYKRKVVSTTLYF